MAAGTTQAIIDAAAKLFEKRGYEHLSMRNIAREVGCSATTIYIYFENKDALFVELIKQAYANFNRSIREVLGQGAGHFRDRFCRACFAYVHFGLTCPKYYHLMFRDNVEQFIDISWKDGVDERSDAFALLRRAVEDGIRKGVIRGGGGDANLVSRSIWASLHGLTSLLLAFPGFEWQSREASIDYHVNVLMSGVLVASPHELS